MKYLIILVLPALVACGKSEPSAQIEAPLVPLSIPSQCIFSSTGMHNFTTQGTTEVADIYDCPIYPNLDCTYAKSASRQELTCVTPNLASPQATPSGCSYRYGGTRLFLDGTTLGSTNYYDCGHPYGGLGCAWFSHASGRGDLICVDYY